MNPACNRFTLDDKERRHGAAAVGTLRSWYIQHLGRRV
jgi:hypothetical protein